VEEGVIDAVLERLFLGGDESGRSLCGQAGGNLLRFCGVNNGGWRIGFPAKLYFT